MRKRVLLIEGSEATRKIAEDLLRQNGFEVVSVPDSAKAMEVLGSTTPDLMITGLDLQAPNKRPLYEEMLADPKTGSIPLLLLAGPDSPETSVGNDLTVRMPLDPRDFMSKVQAAMGKTEAPAVGSPGNPLEEADLGDDFLDAALGLDQINVTESEVMDRTGMGVALKPRKEAEKLIGLDHFDDTGTDNTDSGRVESIIISEDSSDIVQGSDRSNEPDLLSASAGIEIVPNEFGLTNPGAANADGPEQVHDYGWFVDEMRRDSSGQEAGAAGDASSGAHASSKLRVTDPSEAVDPITPPPQSPSAAKPSQPSDNVEHFIDEFKKEVEKFRSEDSPSGSVPTKGSDSAASVEEVRVWEDTLEKLSPEKIELFTKQFASELADKVAQKIVARIDSDKLMGLMRKEILARLDHISKK